MISSSVTTWAVDPKKAHSKNRELTLSDIKLTMPKPGCAAIGGTMAGGAAPGAPGAPGAAPA